MTAPPTNRTARHGVLASRAGATLLFAVGAVVLANLLSTRFFTRLDLTEGHTYTLSDGTRAVLRAMPDYLTIKAYVSKDLPPELATARRYVRDLLEEYRAASNGKLRFEQYDPAADKTAAEAAERCRVGKVGLQVRRGSKIEAGSYYLGLCFWYDGKSRAISEIGQPSDLEYRVSSLIKRMTQPKRKVAFTAGHGEQDLGQGYSFVKLGVGDEADVVSLNPSVAPISDDVDLLVVAGPRTPLDDRARREIDAYVMRGKSALFLIDGATPAAGPGGAGVGRLQIPQPVDSGLDPLLESYGFRIGRDFAFDRLNVPGPFTSGDRQLLANAPAFVAARPEAAATRDHTILAGVTLLVFPFASTVQLAGPLAGGAPRAVGPGLPPGRLFRLARTSPDAWRQTGPFALEGEAAVAAAAPATGAEALAYAYEGFVKSAFPPADIGAAGGGRGRAFSAKPVRLVVTGDSDFTADAYVQLIRSLSFYAGGPQLLFNAVSWALEDETLTPLRANVLRARPLEAISEDRAAVLKWGSIAGGPAALCAAGLLRRWRLAAARRRQRFSRGPA